MKSLESMSTAELRQLIVDATDVLALRAAAVQSAKAPASSSLFTFGAVSSGGNVNPFASSTGAGLFSGTVAGCGASPGAKLFGGTGAGLFSGALAGAEVPVFSPPSRESKQEKKTTVKSADKSATVGNAEPYQEEEEVAEFDDPSEEVTIVEGWTPSITLEVADNIETGEEGEEELYAQRSKLYRFRDSEWKERGLGEARLLKDKTSGRVRFLLRQEKTGKVAANFLVIDRKPYCDLRPNAESEKIWVWSALDSSDGDAVEEKFALKFGTVELAAKFKEAFEEARQLNSKVLKLVEKEGNSDDAPDSCERQ